MPPPSPKPENAAPATDDEVVAPDEPSSATDLAEDEVPAETAQGNRVTVLRPRGKGSRAALRREQNSDGTNPTTERRAGRGLARLRAVDGGEQGTQDGQADAGAEDGSAPQGTRGKVVRASARRRLRARQDQSPSDDVAADAPLAKADGPASERADSEKAEPVVQYADPTPPVESDLTLPAALDPAVPVIVETPAEVPHKRSRGPGQKPVKREDPFANYRPAPTARPARMRQRHWGLVAFFCLLVILPAAFTTWYMYARAADQYESDIGFGSRTENAPSTFSFLGLGSLGGLGASSSGDMDILYQFISSQELVLRVGKKLDLRTIYSKAKNDPYFSFPSDGKIEDLVSYWSKMVVPSYDSSTGLMTVRVFAFDPDDAKKIATVVLDESTSIINELSETAQQDATRYGKQALDKAQTDMANAQKELTTFRIENNIVDPTDKLQGANLVVTTLIQQLGTAEIDLDMLTGTVPDTDPRIAQLGRRIEVIQKRIEEERSKVGGLTDTRSPGYAKLVADYQALQMNFDFAQKAYLTALASYDQAVTDAQHKTRYLATFVSPTLAESSSAPNRPLWIFLAGLVGFLVWASLSMIYYALRDRR